MQLRSGFTTAAIALFALAAGPALAQPDFEPAGNKARSLQLAQLRYLADSGDPYSALAQRRRFAERALDSGDFFATRVKLAQLAADYGLLEVAEQAYRRDLNPTVGYEQRNRDWYELAQAWFARGYYQRAQQAFDNIFGAVPEDLKNELPPFEARLLIARGENEAAVELLRKWRRKRIRDPLARYNLAVALARAGKQQEGAGELNAIGSLRSKRSDYLALRDQANLVLGFGYLEIGQGATARTLFQRIRLDGPYSDKALLGLGWAEIAPDGERQEHTLVQTIRCVEDPARLLPDNLPVLRRIPREACGPPQEFRDTDKFESKKGGETEAQRYRNALIPWLELIKRNPRYAAVQEGLISLPYAYAKLGARDTADRAYENAIRVLDPEHDRLLDAIEQLQKPTAQGTALPPAVEADRDWFAQRWGLYTAVDAPFFTDALSEQQFRVAAQSLQDLLVLQDQLIVNESRMDALRAQLSGRRTALLRGGIALPPQLRDEQRRLLGVSQKLAQSRDRIASSIAQLSDFLRGRMLASARRHEQRLQNYLTNARISRANLSEISLAEDQKP